MKNILLFIFFLSSIMYAEKPNIILIMCDDMGFSDIAPYGSEIETPALSRLAKEGLKFRQFYNNAKCTTTRASIMTGLYPRKTGHQIHLLTNKMYTLAMALKKEGYYTILSGKWHLGSKKGHRPNDRGFDEAYGLLDGCSNFFDPSIPDPKFKGGKTRVFGHNEKNITSFPKDFYTTDAFTDHAISQIQKSIKEKKPYFLHLTYTAPHYPLHAKEEDIKKYKGKYKDGWEKLQETRAKRQLELKVFKKEYPRATLKDGKITSWSKTNNKGWNERRMEVYAAMIDSMDQNINKILTVLDETKTFDNTIIMFLSDNGGCAETPGGTNTSRIPGPKEFYTHCGKAWAWAQNTPFRKYKTFMHEGGIATPFIISWPKKIKKNEWTDQVGHIIDLQPTLLDLVDGKIENDKKYFALEGISLKETLINNKIIERTKPLFFSFQGKKAVRLGKWKACYSGGKNWELYDIEKDRTEKNNLAKKHPKVLEDLVSKWKKWDKQTLIKNSK